MSKPLIGVTTTHLPSKSGHPLLTAAEAYTQSIQHAGGLPVLLPLDMDQEEMQALLEHLDGVLLTGGGDMDPARYGGQPHPKVYDVDAVRDRMELDLTHLAIEQHKPFLCICRGFQVLNVALGGSLYEHIEDQHAGALKHDYFPNYPRSYLAHNIQVKAGCRLASIFNLDGQDGVLPVNSLHHQGVRQVGTGLEITALAPDGIVEAVELPDHPFGLAVQWHPEWMQEVVSPNGQYPMRRLFQAFIQCAKGDRE